MLTIQRLQSKGRFGALWDDDSDDASTSTVVNTAEPAAFLTPFLTDIAEAGRAQAAVPREFFPGQTFAPTAPETELGLQLQTERALAGSPTLDAANTQLQQTLQGDFQENPFTDQLTQSIVRSVKPGIDAQFQAAGRSGSGLSGAALASNVTDRLAPLAFQNFQNERLNQIRAASLAPGLAQGDFADAQALSQVGAARQGIGQQAIDESINRFNFEQIEPIERLQNFANLLGTTNFGGVTTSQSSATQPGRSNIADLAGLGLSAAGTAALLGFKPFA